MGEMLKIIPKFIDDKGYGGMVNIIILSQINWFEALIKDIQGTSYYGGTISRDFDKMTDAGKRIFYEST